MDATLELGQAKLSKLFIKYSIPSIIGMLFFSIYIVIDGIFVGQVVGANGLAAINIAMPFFSIAMAVSIMVSSGANTIVAIELGQGQAQKACKTFSLAFYTLTLVSGVVCLMTLIFIEPICKVLGATPELMPLVKDYLAILCIFTPIFTGSGLLSGGIRSMGKPTYSMICTVIGSVLNILFDYFFVVVWGMGVSGAALASGLAFMIAFLVGFVAYLPRKNVLHFTRCSLDYKKIGRFLYNGSSEALTEVSVAFSTYLFNIVLLIRIGEKGVSAFSIITYVTSLIIAVLLGVATGIAPITGYNYGAGHEERVIALNNLALKVMFTLGILCTLCMFIFGRPLILLFAPGDEALIQMTVWATKLYSLAFLVNGINILASSYFTALEDAKTSALISLLRGIILIFIGILILPVLVGDAGIWLTVFFSEIMTLLYTQYLFKKSYQQLRQKATHS